MRLALLLLVACGADAPTPVPPETETETEPEPEAEPEAELGTTASEVRCDRDDECVPGRDACNALVGVRRDHAEAYEARMAELRPVVNCVGIGETETLGELQGFCDEGACRAGDTATRCSSTDECVKVDGACQMFSVVHRDFEPQARAYLDRMASVISCAAGQRVPDVRLECRDGLCVGDVQTQ